MGIAGGSDLVVGVDDAPLAGVEGPGQLGKGDESDPVAFPGPAARRNAALAAPAHGDPAGGVEPDVALGIGVHHVHLGRVEVLHGGDEVLPAAGPVEPVQGLHRAVVLIEGGGGERQHPALAGDARRPVRRVGNHRAMPGPAYLQHHVVGVAHGDDLVAQDQGPIPPGRQVAAAVLGIEPLYEQVLHVAMGAGHAPGDAAVVAEQHKGDTGGGGAGDLQAGRHDAGQVPQNRGAEAEMGIVGEDRLAARGARSRHRPGVGGAARRSRRLQRRQSIQGQPLVESRQILGRHRSSGGVGRPHLGDPLGRQAAGEAGAQDFVPAVAAEPERHEPCPQKRIGGAPRLRRVAQQKKLGRQRPFVSLDPGVDAGGIGHQRPAYLRIHSRVLPLGQAVEPQHPHETVRGKGAPPQHFGQTAGAKAAHHLHLPQAVPGVHETEGQGGVRRGAGEDVGNAAGVAHDIDGFLEAGGLHGPVRVGHGGEHPVGAGGAHHEQ